VLPNNKFGKWVHIAYGWSSEEGEVYIAVDGDIKGTLTATKNGSGGSLQGKKLKSTNKTVKFGFGASDEFVGKIDEIRFYDSYFKEEKLQKLMQIRNPRQRYI